MTKAYQDLPDNVFPPISQTRIRELEELLPEKPEGIGHPASNRKTWEEMACTAEGRELVKAAEAILEEPFPELSDDLYLEFSRTGVRINYHVMFRRQNTMIITLALAECIEYKGRFLPKLEEGLDKFLSQKSWVLPAHDSRLAVFNNKLQYPDLICSSVTAMAAYIDWFLQDRLRPETRQRIREETERRTFATWRQIFRSGQITDEYVWMKWMNSRGNWNAVCTCLVLAAALVLFESRHDRAEALAVMEISNKYFLSGFTSDGYCSEGLGYWTYGFGHFLTMGEIVLASTKGRLNIFKTDPIIRKCCEYARNIMIEDGVAPAYADCSINTVPNPFYMAIIQKHFPECLLKPVPKPILETDIIFPVIMINYALIAFQGFATAEPDKISPIPPVSFFDEAGILICRSKDDKGNTLGVAIKGGHNNEAHNHNDVGSYVIVVNGTQFVCDPGGEVYSARTFGPLRYTSKVINSYGHDVPVVAGELQSTGAEAHGLILESTFTPEKSTILIDMTSCYAVEELVSLTRRMTFDRVARKITITDNVEFKTPQTFEDAIVTASDFRANSKSDVEFYNQNTALAAEISVIGSDWTLSEELIENPRKVSPTRFAVRLDQPVLKATVECVFSSIQP